MKIHLHLGAHKTATTSQQTLLQRSLPALQAHDVGYMPLDPVREMLSHPLMRLDPATFRIEDHLHRFFPQGVPAAPRGIIVSDENLIGSCRGIVTTGLLYDTASKRLAHLRNLMAGHELVVFLSIRGYGEFLAAAYCEALVGLRQFIEFAEFRKRLKLGEVVWPQLVDVVCDALRPEQIRLWRFEDYPAHAERVLSALAFDAPGPLVVEQTTQRPSFSQASVNFLALAAERLGSEAAGKLIDGVNAAAPRSAGFVRFNPWEKAQRDRFDARYRSECLAMPPSSWVIPIAEEATA